MLTITPQQGRERYKIIPTELQDLIFAEDTKELFDHIGEENHLNEDKTYELGRIAGLVLLGFLHKDDTRKELQEVLAVNPMIANELQNELNNKLFNPISQLLDKIYSPLSKNTLSSAKSLDSVVPLKPVSIDNMPKPVGIPAAPQATAESPTPKSPSFSPSVPPASFPNTKIPQIPTAPGAVGVVPASQTKISPLAFTKTPSLTPAPAEVPKPMSFVTQTNSQSAPVGNVPKFKIETPGTLSGSAFGGSNRPTFSSAPRPAKIELGFSTPDKKVLPTPSTTFETRKSSVRYGTPTAPSFSVQSTPSPEVSPSLVPKTEIAPTPKKLEVTMSGLKIPPTPPKSEPPKPLL